MSHYAALSLSLSPGKKWENVYKMFACSELGAEFGRGRAMLHCTTIKAEDDAMLARIWRGQKKSAEAEKGEGHHEEVPLSLNEERGSEGRTNEGTNEES